MRPAATDEASAIRPDEILPKVQRGLDSERSVALWWGERLDEADEQRNDVRGRQQEPLYVLKQKYERLSGLRMKREAAVR